MCLSPPGCNLEVKAPEVIATMGQKDDSGFPQALTADFSHLTPQNAEQQTCHTPGLRQSRRGLPAEAPSPGRLTAVLGWAPLESQGQRNCNSQLMACSWQGIKSPIITMNKTLSFNSFDTLPEEG